MISKLRNRSFFIPILLLLYGFACTGVTKSKKSGDSFMQLPNSSEFQLPAYPAPDWLRNAVIMEIPIRAFNHPDYQNPQDWDNECGNASYLSILEKLPFLKKLGINVICLYSVYHHTAGTNLYAIRHHEADPELGTIEDIKRLISEAHKIGFHVISNTNHYACDLSSPMIREHPDWFIAPENDLYGQRVFDLGNPEVVKYIIDTHAWWCTEVGLDGWRIDIAHETYRKYIWDPILETCASKGKQILLAPEGAHLESHIRGAGWGSFPVSLDMADPMAGWKSANAPYGTLKGYKNTSPGDPYRIKDISSHNSKVPCPHNFNPEDCTREGAYQVQGSRFLFGHNLMFAPFVPWMMHGEIFNATHLGVPCVMDHRLKGKLLHSYLNWDDLDKQKAVLLDFKKIVDIRLEHQDLFHNNLNDTQLLNVPYNSDAPINAKPYIRFIPGKKAAVVVGNNSTSLDVTFKLNIPVEDLEFDNIEELTVYDLWAGTRKSTDVYQLNNFQVTIPRDKSPGGGVRVFLLTPK